ncbi:VacJ family lipoprotein [Litorivicinus lipolyticus]|uniref:VacJ family lipoprotein n=2 Tax=Litorivicinus lipolyticus TaxID=418701 RepID=A0A5Q2QBS8_9GAMM|nr:VacJ family lipoprotein [Litorivicinus lipolyticus]
MKPLMTVVLLTASLGAMATPVDPLEPVNRAVFAFNDAVDRVALRPAASAYQSLLPRPIRSGIGNFFSNLGEVSTFLNAALQGKPDEAANALGRFVFNSTLGLGGILDVMTEFGAPKTSEDFGQTLGVWGVGEGAYVVLPFFGPSTVRDGLGRFSVDATTNPVNYLSPSEHRLGVTALSLINRRAQLLGADALVNGDRYVALRNLWLQNRRYQVNDGADASADAFLEDF